MEKYDQLTSLLKKDNFLSLYLSKIGMSYGIENVRIAEILEPNPNEGQVIQLNEEQSYKLGPRRIKSNFELRGRDINESLDLLEKRCAGEKEVKNTVSYSYTWDPKEGNIHGYPKPSNGLDSWLFAGCNFEIKKEGQVLVAKMYTNHFNIEDIIIFSEEIENVDEAIHRYDNQPQGFLIAEDIQRGRIIKDRLLRSTGWNSINISKDNNILNPKFIEEYNQLINHLSQQSLNLSEEAKEFLFTSMLLKGFYKKERK